MSKSTEIVGKNIRKLRKGLNLSQQQMAEQVGISYKYLGEIERGEVNLSVEILMKISNSFQIEPGNLLASNERGHSNLLEAQVVLGEFSNEQLELALDLLKALRKHYR
ncbi:helix-turn-helix domain-containing protein [Maridesulfovibrio sp.]|uniref:helix-turn-helix domain-containing protein n=1 Tax=Maridesulfovibrio sp. TaxID=2795000 RepID=UPI003B008354